MDTDRGREHDELLALVRRHATGEGRTDAAHPGVWFWRSDRPWPRYRARAMTLSLSALVQGRKLAHVDGRTLHYDPANYLVLTGETEFEAELIEASPERPYLSMGVAVPPEIVARTLLTLADDGAIASGEPEPAAFVAPLEGPVLGALCRLARALDDPAERTVLAPLIVEELVFRLLRSDAAALLRRAVLGGDERRIEEVMAFIRANAATRLTVEDLARRVAMSPSHFAHRFRAVARVSPMRYVKHVRLHDARRLLLDGARASEAGDRVGYASPSHFTRDFKSYFGVPPAAYARRLRAPDAPQDRARQAQAPA